MAFPETGGYGASDDAPVSEPLSEPPPAMGEYDDEETAALAEAFPEMASDPARLEAFKTAVKICVENAMSGSKPDRGSSPPPPRGKGGGAKAPSALILALGKPPKKASG